MKKPRLSRRGWLAQALSLGALGGCATPWDGKTPYTTATGFTLYPIPEWKYLSWDHPENLARWERELGLNRTMRNDWKDGLAISAGGKYVASPVGASPLNAITIVAVETGERWRIAHSNPRVQVTNPAFSPDGERIAVIASPPTYGGDCEIWIAPVRGGEARVIRSELPRSMRWPFFSWDGTRIACFRDILDRPAESEVKPEYRGDEFGALFEYDIATGVEAKVGDLVVSIIASHAAYAPNDRDFFVGARQFGGPVDLQARAQEYGAGKSADCGRLGCFPDFGPIQPPLGLVEGRRLFEVRRGVPVLRFPKAARPAVVGSPGAMFGETSSFYGADRHGRLMISNLRRAHVCDETGIVKTLDLAAWPLDPGHINIDFCAISSDGEAIAASTALGFVDEGTRIDVLRNGAVSTFLLKPADDSLGDTVRMTDAAGISQFPE